MARKLSDAEFVERTRNLNRRRSERQRQRLSQSGKSALTVWIPDTVRQSLTAAAAANGATIADTATQWLMTAANLATAPTAPTLPAPVPVPEPVATLPLFQSETTLETTLTSDTDNRVDRDQQILELRVQGETYAAIGRQFNLNESAIRKIVQRLKAKESPQ